MSFTSSIDLPHQTITGSSSSVVSSSGLDHRKLVFVLFALFGVRLLFVFWLPFTDTTEARYAEIARKMVETNDWITPQFDYGVPFWGKPPLHTWLSALGMKLFGVGAFGARVLIFASAIGALTVLYLWARLEAGRTTALLAIVVCASSVMFFGASAFVMTDIPMVLGTTLSMVGFYIGTATSPNKRLWGHLFFVGLAIGMLAKGPTAVVLTGIPIFLWLLIGSRWRLLTNLPWITGLSLALLLAGPWYIAAEIKTPGFLQYFIIGEHVERFLVPGWKGDLYGSGHDQPKGMIWLFALAVFAPWTFLLLAQLLQPKKVFEAIKNTKHGRLSYLLLWTVSPMLLFTPAANILPAYVLPGVPAFSFLVAMIILSQLEAGSRVTRFGFWACLTASLTFFCAVTVLSRYSPETIGARTMDNLVDGIENEAPEAAVYTFPRRSYSAEFYTQGKAATLASLEELSALASNGQRDAVIVTNKSLSNARATLGDSFFKLSTYRRHTVLLEASK